MSVLNRFDAMLGSDQTKKNNKKHFFAASTKAFGRGGGFFLVTLLFTSCASLGRGAAPRTKNMRGITHIQ